MTTVREYFVQYDQGRLVPGLKGIVGTYRFDVDGEGSWLLRVDHGHTRAQEGREDADCVVGCSAADFFPIINGELNILTACMQGRLSLDGDPIMITSFRGIVGARHKRPQDAERHHQHP